MKSRNLFCPIFIAALAAYGGVALAQEGDDLVDETMQLVDEEGGPENAIETLALPENASPQGVESSAEGLATANEARERQREFGESRAAEAREGVEAARMSAADGRDEARLNATEARSAAESARQGAADARR